MILFKILVTSLLLEVCLASQFYKEHLNLKPYPRNKLLTGFDFNIQSQPFELTYHNESNIRTTPEVNHYSYFPSSLGPIISSTNTRELHLRFTQGWWDAQSWGVLPHAGEFSGGTGVEVMAVIEAPDIEIAKRQWKKLTKILSGFFCASLNFIDDDITTYPKFKVGSGYAPEQGNHLYLLRAALPSEPVCTENLTPFLRLLPTRGKSGISTLLDGHKVFDSLWHGMSIDVTTECEDSSCFLQLHQTINQMVDIIRSIRKQTEGGIPKPIAGDKLRCDPNKTHTIWQCFPLGDPVDLGWSLETIYGRKITGCAFEQESSTIAVEVDPNWDVTLVKESPDSLVHASVTGSVNLEESLKYDLKFSTKNSSNVLPIVSPPIYASRSLTGYSLDKGGLRVSFTNPSSEPVTFIYFESIPWFMRLYFNDLKLKLKQEQETDVTDIQEQYIKERYYKPAIDRTRPSHMELKIVIPSNSSLVMTYSFDKSLLLYHEYPPDANHGFDIEPAVITILDKSQEVYQFRTTSLLLTLPTPDFSMPYNVIILTCTVLSLAFGIVFNLVTKQVPARLNNN
ncbi:GPI transamidase component GPI16 [Spathaspora sp. JA1]|nr:GPI transamidase component GPI16 [Spathaspora sp. JA1]